MLKRWSAQSVILLSLGALIAGQIGPCGGLGGNQNQQAAGGNLVGVWRASYVDPLVGLATVELVLQANGQFSKQTSSAFTLTMISGPYTVDFPAAGLLRLTVFDWFPKETCGPLGCNPVIPIAGETYNYSFADANTLQLRDTACVEGQGVSCTGVYTRVQ